MDFKFSSNYCFPVAVLFLFVAYKKDEVCFKKVRRNPETAKQKNI